MADGSKDTDREPIFSEEYIRNTNLCLVCFKCVICSFNNQRFLFVSRLGLAVEKPREGFTIQRLFAIQGY